METNMSQKSPKYFCEKCGIKTNNKKDYEKHLATLKHSKVTQGDALGDNSYPISSQYNCENCKKEYKSRNGLWKHRLTCKSIINNYENASEAQIMNIDKTNQLHNMVSHEYLDKNMTLLTNLIVEVVKNNNEFQKQILDLVKNSSTNISNSNINSNNQTFNLQLFLNETCKDAMNMSDFINSFNLQTSDLERLADDGYVKTMSNLIINKVRELDTEKRPIHCSDAKREVVYIKEDDVWIKDDEEKSNLRKAVNKIGCRNIGVLQDWQQAHPNCIKANSPYNDTYLKMMREVMGGRDSKGNDNKVIKNIIKEVVIDKQQYIS